MSLNVHRFDTLNDAADSMSPSRSDHVVLTVLDHMDARPDLRQAIQLKGYRVIDTDNGREAAKNARETRPDLLVVDMDVPLVYGVVAARQIIKHAQVEPMPVVIVSHDEFVELEPLMEVGARSNEYVTRLSDYLDLQHLLDYLLPVLPTMADALPTNSLRLGTHVQSDGNGSPDLDELLLVLRAGS